MVNVNFQNQKAVPINKEAYKNNAHSKKIGMIKKLLSLTEKDLIGNK